MKFSASVPFRGCIPVHGLILLLDDDDVLGGTNVRWIPVLYCLGNNAVGMSA